jgi:hypothetical protein
MFSSNECVCCIVEHTWQKRLNRFGLSLWTYILLNCTGLYYAYLSDASFFGIISTFAMCGWNSKYWHALGVV